MQAARNREEGNILSAELDEAIFCASAIAADLHKQVTTIFIFFLKKKNTKDLIIQETLKNIIEIAAVSVN